MTNEVRDAAGVPTLPYGPLDLLVRAAMAPPEQAKAAWAEWRRGYAIDETPWNEVRLLGAVAERMSWLEPEADILPRMKGIQKFLYAQTHMCLTACTGALKIIAQANIPMMALKGAARVVADGSKARQRLVRDADVLVPIPQADAAFNALKAAGWSYKPEGSWQTFWRDLDKLANHHAWSLSRDGGDLDLHHFSNSLNRLIGDDDGLWARGQVVKWRGLDIHVPSPADALVLGIVHGLRWSPECNADWIIDVASAMDTGQIDWDIVLAEGRRREVQAILLTGLTYLRDTIGRDVPQAVTDSLAAEATELQWAELASYAAAAMPRNPAQNKPMLAMALQRAGGPPGRAGSEHGLLRVMAKRVPYRSMVAISPAALQQDATRLTVRLTGAAPADAKLTATLCILGIVTNRALGTPGWTPADGAFQDFEFLVPTRLLRRRGAQNLCLTIASVERPAYPPWRY